MSHTLEKRQRTEEKGQRAGKGQQVEEATAEEVAAWNEGQKTNGKLPTVATSASKKGTAKSAVKPTSKKSPPPATTSTSTSTPTPTPTPTPVLTPGPASAPAPTKSVVTVLKPESKVQELTRATLDDYQGFFQLYATFVRRGKKEGFCTFLGGISGKEDGLSFLPLGWIPGDGIILHFKGGKVKMSDATTAAKTNLPRPTEDFIPVEQLPKAVLSHLAEWKGIIEALSYEPSPWNLGFATTLLRGEPPREHLTISFPRFRFGKGDPEVPVGISLVPDWGGMKVSRIYNPRNMPGLPEIGKVFTVEEIQRGGNAPFHKLIRTWARMESYSRNAFNFNGR